MPRIEDCLIAAEAAAMLADNPPVLAKLDAVGIGTDLDRAPDRTRRDRVLVVVEAHKAGLGDRCRNRVEAIEASGTGNETRPFGLKGLPDGPVALLGMAMRLGVRDALVEKPGVQLVITLHPQPRREEALAHQTDLVLDLPFLPARGRRAGDRLDQVMAAHLNKAAIVDALLTDKDRLDRGLHVVVDAARAGALEEGEGPVMGVEHHLLGLAGIGAHEQHAAVAEPDMG